ncbi:beta-L-arabinofuranosidase domain-containing protein [Paenibacillus massiliensis]|uniref:beta-L-arabinofuranosidase domain-containing protein n=1 Tax=Paenibacillus massiliensis TaxID=225917 RepID=UPI00046E8145|nr:beta-L-arabinofuranosidase domain-containing protein [Paenibacillus massiliensis]
MANVQGTLLDVPLKDLRLAQVRLQDEYCINAFDKELAYLRRYEPDRLLSSFRTNRGLSPKAEPYPGWESTEIRGHTLGHYLTAVAQAYCTTQDTDLHERLVYIVEELELCQFENGYISAFPEKLFDHVENGKPAWVPWYTMHKIIAGIVSVYHATQNMVAYRLADRLGDWVANRALGWTEEVHNRVLAVEYGGMNDALYHLYRITAKPSHMEAAHRFDELTLFHPVQQGRDILQGKHANTTIPKFLGALHRYQLTGESFYLEASIRFWDMVVEHHSYMTGGNSEWEHFGEPDQLDGKRSPFTCETCNSYNMLKLSRELFKLTGDMKYADFYENTFRNAILSSQHPETGMTMYFQPMATGYFKVYSSEFEHFWCCTGTGMESFTKLNDSLYYEGEHALYITQFMSSTVDWETEGLKVHVDARVPTSDQITLQIQAQEGHQAECSIHVRVPYWSTAPVELEVNGENVMFTPHEGWLTLKRSWTDGDKVRIRLPMSITYEALPDAQYAVGFRYGPVVLSAALGQEDLSTSATGVMVSVPTRHMPVKDFITLAAGMTPAEWLARLPEHLVQEKEALSFRLRHTDDDDRLVFTPHYLQHRERYGIYWHLVQPDSTELQQHIKRSKAERRMVKATVDSLPVGNDQHELEHQVQGERTSAGTWDGYSLRKADTGGWFSYMMRVEPQQPNYLSVLYYTAHTAQELEIRLNDHFWLREHIPRTNTRTLTEKRYLLPDHIIMTQDGLEQQGLASQHVKVTFAASDTEISIYHILRTMRAFDAEAALQQLLFNEGTLSPAFAPELNDYTLTIGANVKALQASFVPQNDHALIYVDGTLIDESVMRTVKLSGERQELVVRVVAEDFTSERSYLITIQREPYIN